MLNEVGASQINGEVDSSHRDAVARKWLRRVFFSPARNAFVG